MLRKLYDDATGLIVGLGIATSGGAGTLISSVTTTTANALAINANPSGYYVNIRGQLGTIVPEPALSALIGAGALALLARRRLR